MRLLTVFFAAMALVNSVFGQVPAWVTKFRAIVERVDYEPHQSSLSVLHAALKKPPYKASANCKAFFMLAAECAMESGEEDIICEAVNIGPVAGGLGHRIGFIRDSSDRVWMVSNDEINQISDEREAIEGVIKRLDKTWEFRTLPAEIYASFSLWDDREPGEYGDWEIRERCIFTKEELK